MKFYARDALFSNEFLPVGKKAQAEAHKIVSEVGFQVASVINVFENRVELYADNPAQPAEAIKKDGLALLGHVLIIGH